MTTTCKICHRERYIKAAGMCRTCREKHLNKRMRPIGDAKARILELINHYGNLNLVASRVGIARNTVDRIQYAEVDSRIQRAAYNAIMNHQITDSDTDEPKRLDRITWPEVAEYARTPNGQAFVAKCRGMAA